VVLIAAALAVAERLVALDELVRPDPLDPLEVKLVLDLQPHGRPVLLAERLAVHLVGQERMQVHEVLD
jgi:hypothetical protein